MTTQRLRDLALNFAMAAVLSVATANAAAADQALLDILLGNGAITKAQYDELMKKPSLSSADFGAPAAAPAASPTEGAALRHGGDQRRACARRSRSGRRRGQ